MSWTQIQHGFDLQKGKLNGRLKTKFKQETIKAPPDLLINVTFDSSFGYLLTAEIQIHLRSIHIIKQEDHILYEIRRMKTSKELYS